MVFRFLPARFPPEDPARLPYSSICARMIQFIPALMPYAASIEAPPPSCAVVKMRAAEPADISACDANDSSPVDLARKLATICGARPAMSTAVVQLYRVSSAESGTFARTPNARSATVAACAANATATELSFALFFPFAEPSPYPRMSARMTRSAGG